MDRLRDKWLSYGNTEDRNRSEKELESQFLKCDMQCHSAARGDELELYNEQIEYVDILEQNVGLELFSELIHNFIYKTKRSVACNYCDSGTILCKEIEAVVQIK